MALQVCPSQPGVLDSPQTRDTLGLFDSALVGLLAIAKLTREPLANFRLGVLLPTQECMITFRRW
jgi:hypothetical protein